MGGGEGVDLGSYLREYAHAFNIDVKNRASARSMLMTSTLQFCRGEWDARTSTDSAYAHDVSVCVSVYKRVRGRKTFFITFLLIQHL